MKVETYSSHYLQGCAVYSKEQEMVVSGALNLLCTLMCQEYRFSSLTPRGIIIKGWRRSGHVEPSYIPQGLRYDETQLEIHGPLPAMKLLFRTAVNFLTICVRMGDSWSDFTLLQHATAEIYHAMNIATEGFRSIPNDPLLNTQRAHRLKASILLAAGVPTSDAAFAEVCKRTLDDVICVATLVHDGATVTDALEFLGGNSP